MCDRLGDQAPTEGFPSGKDLRKQRKAEVLIMKGAKSSMRIPLTTSPFYHLTTSLKIQMTLSRLRNF
jgi:hypothetical protein